MKASVFFVSFGLALSIVSCGAKDDSAGDFYQSCSFTMPSSSDKSRCLESKNSTSIKEDCEVRLMGTYAQTQCTVSSGVKGCSFTNANGVSVTDWYTGSAWTDGEVSNECSSKPGSQVVTK